MGEAECAGVHTINKLWVKYIKYDNFDGATFWNDFREAQEASRLLIALLKSFPAKLVRNTETQSWYDAYFRVLERHNELNQLAGIVEANEKKQQLTAAKLKEEKRIKGLIAVNAAKHILDPEYDSDFFKAACGRGPPRQGGASKTKKKHHKPASQKPTKTNKRITCKDGKKRTVYVKAGMEYVKRRDKNNKMHYVRTT